MCRMLQKTVFIGFVKLKYGRGRVYEIVDYGQLLLVNPPLQNLTSYKSESLRK